MNAFLDVEIGASGFFQIGPGEAVTLTCLAEESMRVAEFVWSFDKRSDLSLLDLRVEEVRIGLNTVLYCAGGLGASLLQHPTAFKFPKRWERGEQMTVKILHDGPSPLRFRLCARTERL